MDIFFTDSFKKHFNKLEKDIQSKFYEKLDIFVTNPQSPSIKNHPLKGYLVGKRAFSVTGNYRVIYKIAGENAIILIDIGTHNQVY